MAVTIRIQTQGSAASEKAVAAVKNALKEMDEVTVQVSQSTKAATRSMEEAEETRQRSLLGSAAAVAKFVTAHWALDQVMKSARREGTAVNAGLRTLRRSVLGMSVATTAATAALTRMRTGWESVNNAAAEALGPLNNALGFLRRMRSLLFVVAGAAGLAALSRRLIEVGEAGAQLAPVERAFEQLAGTVNATSDVLRKDLRQAVSGTVSDVGLMRTAVLALNSGAVQSQEDLVELAAASRVLGRTVGLQTQQALDNLVRAIGTMNPVLLKNLGILVNVSDANREYAANLGVAVSQLDESQRKEAFRLAVLSRVRAGVLRVADEEQLRSERLARLRRELQLLDPQSDQYRRTLAAIAVETSRLAGGTDDLLTRLERMRANMENLRNQTRVTVSENQQLVGVLADLERATSGGNAATRMFVGAVDLLTTSVAALTRLMFRIGPLIAIWLGWRTVAFGVRMASGAVMGLVGAVRALTAPALVTRLGLLLGPKGLLVAGLVAAGVGLVALRGEAAAAAAGVDAAFERMQSSAERMDLMGATNRMAEIRTELDAARTGLEALEAEAERQRRARAGETGAGQFGVTTRLAPELQSQLDAARARVQRLDMAWSVLFRRVVDGQRDFVRAHLEAQDALRLLRGTVDSTFDSFRRLRDEQKRHQDRIGEVRREIAILTAVIDGLDPGSDHFDEMVKALERANEQLRDMERRLTAIQGLSARVTGDLAQQVRRDLAGLQAPGVRPQVGTPTPSRRFQGELESDRLLSFRGAGARDALDSLSSALDELALTGQLTDHHIQLARGQLERAGVATQFIEQALRQYTDAARQQELAVLQAQAVTVAGVGSMAQAWIRGTDQAAQATVNAVTQMLQALSGPGGPLAGAFGGLFGPVVGAVGGIVGALFSRQRRHVQPVSVQSFSSDAERSLEQAMQGPEAVTVNIISSTTGELIGTIEQAILRRQRRDATVRLPSGVVVGGAGG